MSIKKDVVFPNNNVPKHKQVIFDTLSEFRLVKPTTTAIIITSIKEWADNFIDYEFDARYLIPENINPECGIQKYSKINVEACYKLLEPKVSLNLSFGEALFILLGLDPYKSVLPPFHNFKYANYSPIEDTFSLESIFYVTKQYQALRRSSYMGDNQKITSKNLIKLADENSFFTEHIDFLEKRTNSEVIMKKLHKLLIDSGSISGEFYELWQWIEDRNQLSYLAKQLKQVRIFNDNCHQQIKYYIQDPSKAKRPLKNIKDPSNTKTMDNIIAQLIP